MRKILHLVDSLGLGGVQIAAKQIFQRRPVDLNIFLYALRTREKNISINHPHIFSCRDSSKYSLKPLWEINELITKYKIEIIQAHLFRSQVFGWLIKKLWQKNKIKLIFHEHGQIFGTFTSKVEDWLFLCFLRIAQNDFDQFIAVSNSAKQALIDKVGVNSDKIQVLYNFANAKDKRKLNPLEIKQLKDDSKINPQQLVLGFVGRMAVIKGGNFLINALPYLNFDYKLLMIGDGPEKNKWQKLAQDLKVEKNICWTGFVDDVHQYYQIMDILVIPSLSEASPLASYEAQVYGRPVVGSDVPAINELVQEGVNGRLFAVRNSQDLAEKLNEMYQDQVARQKMSIQALTAGQRFTMEKYLDNLEKIYQTI